MNEIEQLSEYYERNERFHSKQRILREQHERIEAALTQAFAELREQFKQD